MEVEAKARVRAAAKAQAEWAEREPQVWEVIVYAQSADIASHTNGPFPVCKRNVRNAEQISLENK